MMTLDKFEEASEKVKEVTLETKLIYSDFLSDQTTLSIFLSQKKCTILHFSYGLNRIFVLE
mgnify:FL=1